VGLCFGLFSTVLDGPEHVSSSGKLGPGLGCWGLGLARSVLERGVGGVCSGAWYNSLLGGIVVG